MDEKINDELYDFVDKMAGGWTAFDDDHSDDFSDVEKHTAKKPKPSDPDNTSQGTKGVCPQVF